MKTLRGFIGMLLAGALISTLPQKASAAQSNMPSAQTNAYHQSGGHHHDGNDDDDDDNGNNHNHRRKVNIILEEVAVAVFDDGVTVGPQLQLQNVGKRKAPISPVPKNKAEGAS